MRQLMTPVIFLLLCAQLFAYNPESNEHIRFGEPSTKGRLLEKNGFVLMYDRTKKDPVWSSYHLKGSEIISGRVNPGAFRPDTSLPAAERTAREDYTGDYDKCPMAPVRDMAYSAKTYTEAFLLSNVCPMDRWLKRTSWTQLEENVRRFVSRSGDAWVITGPVFGYDGRKPRRIGRAGILVPTGFYKILLYQSKDGAFHSISFYMENKKPDRKPAGCLVSVREIEKKTGLNFFSVLPGPVQQILETSKDPGGFFE
jgi:endonuclease G